MNFNNDIHKIFSLKSDRSPFDLDLIGYFNVLGKWNCFRACVAKVGGIVVRLDGVALMILRLAVKEALTVLTSV